MLDLIERKAAGEEIAVQPQAEEPAAAPDLMAALEASLAAVRSGADEDAAEAAPTTSAKSADGDGDGASTRRRRRRKAKTARRRR